MENSKVNRNSLVTVLSLFLLASIGANIFQFFNTREILVERENVVDRIDSLAEKKRELELQYKQISDELNMYKGKSKEMDRLLEEAHAKLDKQKNEIARLLESKQDLDVLRQRYQELLNIRNEFLARIDKLEQENRELRYAKTDLEVKLDKESAEKKHLKSQVDIAARLSISSVILRPLVISAKGREKETEKARRANRLSITFILAENKLAADGPYQIYVRIINPEGYVMADVSKTIRKFRAENGDEIPYSRLLEVNYTGDRMTRTVTWDQEAFNPGTYTVELYIDGYFGHKEKIDLF